jgi:2-iminobutanoate/2-iminopropanoate deaminase
MEDTMLFIHSEKAPQAIGPYSQAVCSGNIIYCSGQLPVNASTGNMAQGILEQTSQVLSNLQSVLQEAGSSKEKVLKTTVYLANMDDFAQMNQVYAEFFGTHKPARATVEVSRLPLGALVEIECMASL